MSYFDQCVYRLVCCLISPGYIFTGWQCGYKLTSNNVADDKELRGILVLVAFMELCNTSTSLRAKYLKLNNSTSLRAKYLKLNNSTSLRAKYLKLNNFWYKNCI